jgi:aspartyl aminopeptidase
MNQPLSQYYIQTAQAASGSGVGAILEALKTGARVVDLGVYPDEENIRVTLGGT